MRSFRYMALSLPVFRQVSLAAVEKAAAEVLVAEKGPATEEALLLKRPYY
jgi:hypothetical protein